MNESGKSELKRSCSLNNCASEPIPFMNESGKSELKLYSGIPLDCRRDIVYE